MSKTLKEIKQEWKYQRYVVLLLMAVAFYFALEACILNPVSMSPWESVIFMLLVIFLVFINVLIDRQHYILEKMKEDPKQ